jgi:hypothetical protein
MVQKKGKRKVNRLFELQTAGGFHIDWCSSEEEVKAKMAGDPNANKGETRVYQYIGSFMPVVTPPVWKKMVR